MKAGNFDFAISKNSGIDDLMAIYFPEISDARQETLFAWFLFAISNRGCGFSNLSEKDFNIFQERLGEILKELYKVNHSPEKGLIDGKEDNK